jgi:hypothetical protein
MACKLARGPTPPDPTQELSLYPMAAPQYPHRSCKVTHCGVRDGHRAQPLIAREISEKKWAEARRWACVLLYFHVLSPLCEFYLLATDVGGWQREACNGRGNGQKCTPP